MIKFRGTGRDGRTAIGLGITDRNIEKLREGNPIHIFGEELGMPGFEILLMTGTDEQAITTELRESGLEFEVTGQERSG